MSANTERSEFARVLFSTGSLYPLDTAQCFALAAEAGCDGIEVMCDARWSTRDPTYLGKLSSHHGLRVLVVHTPFSEHVPGWSRPHDQLARILQTLELAETLGAESIVVHLPHKVGRAQLQLPPLRLILPWRSPFGPVKRWIATQLPAVQARTPIKIALENMPGLRRWGLALNPAHSNTPTAWARSHRHLTLDTTHWATLGVDPLDAYRLAGKHVAHLHLSNFDGREHRLPQFGRLDLGQLLRQLAADGFAGTISLELHPDALGFPDPEAIRQRLAESVAFCREHLGQQAPARAAVRAAPKGAA
jgi:sugar phosphate isomerase/epimerase